MLMSLSVTMGDTDDDILCQVALFVMNYLLSPLAVILNPPMYGLLDETNRNPNYYEEVIPAYSFEEFRVHFKMSRACFSNLVFKIENTSCIRDLEKKLLFTVWMLSNQESFVSAGDQFNYSKSASHPAFADILDVLCSLLKHYVMWPSTARYTEISQSMLIMFKEKSGGYIDGTIGAIDYCHIQFKQPTINPINTRILLYCKLCAIIGQFSPIYIYVEARGRLHDGRIFRNSLLHEKIDELIPSEFHLLGDASYPMLRNLVTPFRSNGHLTEQQSHFNTCLSTARVTIDRAFGLLKERFRRLEYIDVDNPIMANKIVVASVILHNHIYFFGDNDNTDEFLQQEGGPDDASHTNDPKSGDVQTDRDRQPGSTKRNFLLSKF